MMLSAVAGGVCSAHNALDPPSSNMSHSSGRCCVHFIIAQTLILELRTSYCLALKRWLCDYS